MVWTPEGGAGPPALPYSARECRSWDFPPLLQSQPPVPPCWTLPGQGGSDGHRGVPIPTTPVHTPGDPLNIPKVSWCLPGPNVCPQCKNTEPLTVSPQPPRCVPCTCPHSSVSVPAAPRGTGMGGGGTKVAPSKARSDGVGGTRGVWDQPDLGSLCSPSHSQGLRHFPHTPASAPGPGWQQEWGCPRGFGAGRPPARGRNPVLDGFVSTSTRTPRDPACEPGLCRPGGGRLGGCR